MPHKRGIQRVLKKYGLLLLFLFGFQGMVFGQKIIIPNIDTIQAHTKLLRKHQKLKDWYAGKTSKLTSIKLSKSQFRTKGSLALEFQESKRTGQFPSTQPPEWLRFRGQLNQDLFGLPFNISYLLSSENSSQLQPMNGFSINFDAQEFAKRQLEAVNQELKMLDTLVNTDEIKQLNWLESGNFEDSLIKYKKNQIQLSSHKADSIKAIRKLRNWSKVDSIQSKLSSLDTIDYTNPKKKLNQLKSISPESLIEKQLDSSKIKDFKAKIQHRKDSLEAKDPQKLSIYRRYNALKAKSEKLKQIQKSGSFESLKLPHKEFALNQLKVGLVNPTFTDYTLYGIPVYGGLVSASYGTHTVTLVALRNRFNRQSVNEYGEC